MRTQTMPAHLHLHYLAFKRHALRKQIVQTTTRKGNTSASNSLNNLVCIFESVFFYILFRFSWADFLAENGLS